MSQRDEIIAKVTQHVAERFEGDWNRVMKHYDWSRDELLDVTEITILFRAAGVSRLVAPFAARQTVAELDADRDGGVSMCEFEKVFNKQQ